MGGEKVAKTPMKISIDPSEVKIMAPESFQDHDEYEDRISVISGFMALLRFVICISFF